ncbi:SDR family oxidoreductase [Streptomyces europaeiscabiei]|uniref:SDR family oxidoreductase n=1 Tax=Streptomyces europaeiscabiei TaxID=146819 RepID=UPI002E19A860
MATVIFVVAVTIVGIDSIGATVCALTKAAVAGLTRGLARELGPRGITVSNVQPRPTTTDMTPDSGPYAESLKQLMPLGQFAEPADIASAVAYLAGPEAHFITGTSWNVDGGIAV